MYARIGQIAHAMGVSTHLLKHYEKIGLIHPIKEEGSNYRYYDSRQCERIVECKKYRNMGLTLKEIGTLLDGEELISANEIAARQMDKLEEEIDQLKRMKKLTKIFYERCSQFDDKCDQWFIEMSAHAYFIPFSEENKLIEGNHKSDDESPLIDLVPLCQQMMILVDGKNHQWGLVAEKNQLEQMGYPVRDFYVVYEPKRVFTAYLKVEMSEGWQEVVWNKLIELYREYTFDPVEKVYMIQLKREYRNHKEYYCSKLIIPIKR